MRRNLLHFSMFGVMTLLLSGCIDNNYDLSDIDTSSEIKITDLVLPLNIDPVTLDDIIKVEDGDKIKKVTVNGKTFYAVEQSGTFNSNPVKINDFTAVADPLSPTVATLHLADAANARRATKGKAGLPAFKYVLKDPVVKPLDYTATSIDPTVHSIESIEMADLPFEFRLGLNNADNFSSVVLNDIELDIPKGLTIKSISVPGANYNPTTGKILVPQLKLNNGVGSIALVATAIDFKANGIDIDYASHTLHLDSHFNLSKVNAELQPSSTFTPPSSITFSVNYTVGNLYANTFTGMLDYPLDGSGLEIDPITLNDLPDFLSGEETNLILANPQIYLNINNPVGNAALNYRSGIRLIANRNDKPSKTFTLDKFEVGHRYGEGPYNFCISPSMPTDIPEEFAAGLEPVTFATLGDILSGEGLPDNIDLELLNPEIYLQRVEKFAIGRTLERMEGNYRFLAPLALRGDAQSGSVIVYSDTQTGWFGDDLKDLTFEHLSISADVTSTIPFGAVLTGYPVDSEGHKIYYTDQDGQRVPVIIEGATIPAGATDYPLTLKIDGQMRDLDGITFEAVVRPDGNDETLAPGQTLTLKNLKAKISGKYITDF